MNSKINSVFRNTNTVHVIQCRSHMQDPFLRNSQTTREQNVQQPPI